MLRTRRGGDQKYALGRVRVPLQGLTFSPEWAYPLPELAPGLTSTFVYVPVCWPPVSALCTLHCHCRHRRWCPRTVHPRRTPSPPSLRDDYDGCSRWCYGDDDDDGYGSRGGGDGDDGDRHCGHRGRRRRCFRNNCPPSTPSPRPYYCAGPSIRLTINHLLACLFFQWDFNALL